MISEPFSGCFYLFFIIHSPALLNIMEHFFDHCGAGDPPGLFIDPQMNPENDPLRLILGDPC